MRRKQRGYLAISSITFTALFICLIALGIAQMKWAAEQRQKCEAAGGIYKLGGEGGDDICFRREQVIDLK